MLMFVYLYLDEVFMLSSIHNYTKLNKGIYIFKVLHEIKDLLLGFYYAVDFF